MKAYHTVIKLQTKEKFQFIDLTKKIKEIIKKSEIHNGIVNIVSRHTTTAILLNENEPLLLQDFIKVIKDLFSHGEGRYCGPLSQDIIQYYQHNDLERRKKMNSDLPHDECRNADAHCSSIFLTNSQTLNIIGGELDLGRWQNILFLELDRDKDREISVMIMGEEKKSSSPDDFVAYWPGPGC